jgi:hypothetical protein
METEEALNIIDALNEVSDVLSMTGPHVTFVGTKVAAMPHVGDLSGIEVYSCPRGWFIHFRTQIGPTWCTAGTDGSEAVAAIEDQGVREVVRQQLQAQQLL